VIVVIERSPSIQGSLNKAAPTSIPSSKFRARNPENQANPKLRKRNRATFQATGQRRQVAHSGSLVKPGSPSGCRDACSITLNE
jgi:hypothetical protein